MHYDRTISLGAVAVLLLSACAIPPAFSAASDPWSQITKQQLVFMGGNWPAPMESNIALSSESNLRMALEAYGIFPGVLNLGDLISQIKAANSNPTGQVPAMTGVGGPLGHGFLSAAEDALDTAGNFNGAQSVILALSGHITDYEFVESGNSGQGNGKLEVITYVTSIKVPHGNGPLVSRTDAYRWKIRVVNNGFRIVPKSNVDPSDPFPMTLKFTPAMLARINFLGFKFKLWAEGTDIKIDEVARKAGNSPTFVVLQKSNPNFAKLYAEVPENCIDMMFVDRPPHLLDGLGPPFYCLGRCANPLIVNTGV